MENIGYFFAAYIVVWVVLFLYLFSISRREKKLRRDLTELNRLVAQTEENRRDR